MTVKVILTQIEDCKIASRSSLTSIEIDLLCNYIDFIRNRKNAANHTDTQIIIF